MRVSVWKVVQTPLFLFYSTWNYYLFELCAYLLHLYIAYSYSDTVLEPRGFWFTTHNIDKHTNKNGNTIDKKVLINWQHILICTVPFSSRYSKENVRRNFI